MTPSLREIVITFRPENAVEVGKAVERWGKVEPFLMGQQIGLGNSIRARLYPVWDVDGSSKGSNGPGTWANDRPRAVEILRACLPENLVESVTVEGVDWNG